MSTVFNLIDIITFKFCSSPFFVFCTYVYVYACIYYMHKSRCVCVYDGGKEEGRGWYSEVLIFTLYFIRDRVSCFFCQAWECFGSFLFPFPILSECWGDGHMHYCVCLHRVSEHLDSGPHDCVLNTLPSQPPPQPSSLSVKDNLQSYTNVQDKRLFHIFTLPAFNPST